MSSQDSLDVRIGNWLQGQGYPLEMSVAQILQSTGLRVIQSEYYKDPESEDYRETDVVASYQLHQAEYLFRVNFVAECKSSTDKPWVLFTSSLAQIHPRASVAQRVASKLGRKLLVRLASVEEVQPMRLFSAPSRPAYGMTQAFTQGRDVPFSAAMSVAKAAYAMAKEADKATEHQHQADACEVVFPIIVVDGKTFESHLDESGNVEVDEISNATLLWRNPIVGMPHTIIDVVSYSYFEEYVSNLMNDLEDLRPHVESALEEMASDQTEQIRRMLQAAEKSEESS